MVQYTLIHIIDFVSNPVLWHAAADHVRSLLVTAQIVLCSP